MLHQPTVLCIGYAVPQGCVWHNPVSPPLMVRCGGRLGYGAADGRHDHKIMVQLQNGA
jgi:hypothetical protein